ncbi:MAG: hypothetical protein CR984_01520 [Proteobacteria bacterium]|nr:MAG: hypothetical protein CR984_01520 [Pseudomonadota bacterium]PIE67664.1 MAG: hypothetical protein CSA23_02500 [Deltaproteobacteria bacterium]
MTETADRITHWSATDMSKREKIILSIMVVTVLSGVYVYWGASAPISRTVNGQDTMQQAMEFAREASRKLKAEDADTTARELFSMRRAERAWQKDPFIDTTLSLSEKKSSRASNRAPVDAKSSIDMVYTGYIEAGSQRLAIINGIEYATGESVNDKGYYVRRIGPQQVDIGRRDAADMIILKYTESGVGDSH